MKSQDLCGARLGTSGLCMDSGSDGHNGTWLNISDIGERKPEKTLDRSGWRLGLP